MLKNSEGQKVPAVIFPMRQGDEWVNITSDDIFAGKTVIVFSLPGAFTPTCSSSHVPRFNELAPVFKKHGVDDIVCISVNDTFVMNEWKKHQKAEDITFIPDGNTDFTAAMGMLVDKRHKGYGMRSWRYSMLVKDGVIEKMFIEREGEGDPFEVSDADTMLEYIDFDAEIPADIMMFSKPGCEYCNKAKELLKENDMPFEEVTAGVEIGERALRAATGVATYPQIFRNGVRIGGLDDLQKWLESGAGESAVG
ncbi:MAG: glutathione peroxidase [Gammaproteobacteria bacterium]|nr:glutathione peroxidase [Gammaproteobacteria bacterium]